MLLFCFNKRIVYLLTNAVRNVEEKFFVARVERLEQGNYPASFRNVGGSTRVPVCAWNNAPKGHLRSSSTMNYKIGKPPYDLYFVDAT
jgi:hypothetical protein